jgi:hypothetical protein
VGLAFALIDGELVALFTEWTSKGEMRHRVFLGLRTDKKATYVIREIPKPGAGH